MDPVLVVSDRFMARYRRGSPGVQHLAEHAIHDFVRLYKANSTTCAQRYGRVAGLKARNVLEFEISGGNRMLGLWDQPRLTLLDLGNHEVVGGFHDSDLRSALASVHNAPPQFLPKTSSKFFLESADSKWEDYCNERSPEWIHFLDRDQARIADCIVDDSNDVLLSDGYYKVHLVLGGPGTGKTCILLNLAKRLGDEAWNIRVVMPPQVAEYIAAATGADTSRFLGPEASAEACDVILVDDPAAPAEISRWANVGKSGGARVVIVAVDPLQLAKALADQDYDKLVKRHKMVVHALHNCYRQKADVGMQTKKAIDAIAKSTPFLDQQRKSEYWAEYEFLTSLSNDMYFPNAQGGYRGFHDNAGVSEFRRELDRVKRHAAGHWRLWPPLLVAVVDSLVEKLPPDWVRELRDSGLEHRILWPQQLEQAKGIEFQHVFLILTPEMASRLDRGFEGCGRHQYEATRLIRIPLSRAKDSLVVFTLPPAQGLTRPGRSL
jgi:hypothetical protein